MLRLPLIKPWKIPLPPIPQNPRTHGVSPLILIYGFIGLILLGSLLLWLPISNQSGNFTSYVDAVFTSTSAVCVTGLLSVDTGDYWSGFGQGVILGLIQIGGFGFMTSITLLLIIMGRKIGFTERLLIAESMGTDRIGGVMRLIKRIAIFTVLTELIGACLLYIDFSDSASAGTAVWQSIFHSISAFNNAGFDIFGNFQSLQGYRDEPLVLLVTSALIILGGISFIVAADLAKLKRFVRLSLDSKIVLITTGALLFIGTIVILITEYSNNATIGPFNFPEKILTAFFQSVTPRTAGFTVIDIGSTEDYTLFFTVLLMFVGGAAASTAGGIKVNTFGILVLTTWSVLRGKEQPGAFGREFTVSQIYRAMAVVVMSMGLVILVVLILTMTQDFRFLHLLFETCSAFGTVGLSTGITPHLTTAGQLIIMVTMFIGRLGPFTLGMIIIQRQRTSTFRYPHEVIRIG